MCLTLVNGKKKKLTAKDDIVVYKLLKVGGKIINKDIVSDINTLHGKDFTGEIINNPANGKISICDNDVYLCTNNKYFDGVSVVDKLGYNYSWCLDSGVKSIIVDGNELIVKSLMTYFQHYPVTIGETYKSKLIRDKNIVEIGLHSFSEIGGCTALKDDCSEIMVKCIIPKGSKYYFGLFECNYSYASDCLKYVEIIK